MLQIFTFFEPQKMEETRVDEFPFEVDDCFGSMKIFRGVFEPCSKHRLVVGISEG